MININRIGGGTGTNGVLRDYFSEDRIMLEYFLVPKNPLTKLFFVGHLKFGRNKSR